MADSKRELEELNLALYNSYVSHNHFFFSGGRCFLSFFCLPIHHSLFRESRRANGNLRANKPDDFLANLLMPNGMINPLFPKNLKELFSLNGKSTECDLLFKKKLIANTLKAATVKTLMKDYRLPDISETNKDHNLNRFMQFCGVRYQLVERSLPSSSSIQVTGKADFLKR